MYVVSCMQSVPQQTPPVQRRQTKKVQLGKFRKAEKPHLTLTLTLTQAAALLFPFLIIISLLLLPPSCPSAEGGPGAEQIIKKSDLQQPSRQVSRPRKSMFKPFSFFSFAFSFIPPTHGRSPTRKTIAHNPHNPLYRKLLRTCTSFIRCFLP